MDGGGGACLGEYRGKTERESEHKSGRESERERFMSLVLCKRGKTEREEDRSLNL